MVVIESIGIMRFDVFLRNEIYYPVIKSYHTTDRTINLLKRVYDYEGTSTSVCSLLDWVTTRKDCMGAVSPYVFVGVGLNL